MRKRKASIKRLNQSRNAVYQLAKFGNLEFRSNLDNRRDDKLIQMETDNMSIRKAVFLELTYCSKRTFELSEDEFQKKCMTAFYVKLP